MKIEWNKNADFYNDPAGLANLLLEELVDWGKERDWLIANGGSEDTITYFTALLNRTETILTRLGVDNIPVTGDC